MTTQVYMYMYNVQVCMHACMQCMHAYAHVCMKIFYPALAWMQDVTTQIMRNVRVSASQDTTAVARRCTVMYS